MKKLHVSRLAVFSLLLLIALNFGLTFLLVGGDEENTAEIAAAKWHPVTNTSTQKDLPSLLQKNKYKQALARPIFFKDRRPYKPPPPKQPPPMKITKPQPPPVTKPDFRLMGIAIISETRRVFLLSPEHQDGVWVKEGEVIEGWRIRQITSNTVTVNKSGRSFDLFLYEKRSDVETAPGLSSSHESKDQFAISGGVFRGSLTIIT